MMILNDTTSRFAVLDGWRGLSILLVLAAHLLPLGPKSWQLNATAGPLGMVLFFTLSGFLITHFLLNHVGVRDFLIRRFFRIIPLAWLYIAVCLMLGNANASSWLAHALFYANWPPMPLIATTGHLWSVCVEVQFYVAVALLVTLLGKRGLMFIPLLCVLFTAYRVSNEVLIAINTWYRVDEILAGSVLALIYAGRFGDLPKKFLMRPNQLLVGILLFLSCHPESGFMNYLRPYFAALLVGSTLIGQTNCKTRFLGNRFLVYFAAISYALYIIHPLLAHSWLGSGEGLEKYLKRPLLFVVLLLLAHFSTYYFEHKWIAFGKRLSRRLSLKSASAS